MLTRKQIMMLMMLSTIFVMAGCRTTITLNESKRLMQHPQFTNAVIYAPEFTRDALKTINKLEYLYKTK
jgi:hypothetical protein